MAGPLGNGDLLFTGTDLLYLTQGGAGHHEGKGLRPFFLLHRLMAQGQPVAVHRYHGKAVPLHFKEGAGVDGPALVVADGKEGLSDHGPQHRLTDGEGVLLVHSGQLGELLRVGAQDVELRQAAPDIYRIALRGKHHHVVGHLADNLPKEPGGEHQGAPFGNLGGDGGLDAGLQVVAGETQGLARLNKNPLHGGDGALGGHRPGGDGHRAGQQGLFTGEFHRGASNLVLSLAEGEERFF